jgi:phosphodiester glycosidase
VARPAEPAWNPQQASRRSHRRGHRGRLPHWARLAVRGIAAAMAVFLVVVGWSIGHALTLPGGGTLSERMAEWARDHYLGPVVTFGEWLTYQKPKVGGNPNVSFKKLGGRAVQKKKHYHQGIVPIIPANVGSPAGTPLPGEGVWKVAVSVHGVPAVFKTYVRQSRRYSSYYAGIVSMDQRLLQFSLRPGTEDPGYGHWGAPMYIPHGDRLGLVATFNSGFRVASSGGGFYLHGHYDGRLVKGEASEVYLKNGHLLIGRWGYGALHMGPDIAAVRQNLRPIVQHGTVPGTVNQNVLTSWGATLGGGYNVWRSGVGITKDGRIIFVYGPALDVRTLADLLRRAGCVTAMELDINPDWMSFMYYLAKNHPASPKPVDLLHTQVQPPDRYFYISNRDFTAVYSR